VRGRERGCPLTSLEPRTSDRALVLGEGFLGELDRVLVLGEGFLGELKLVLDLVEGFLEELKLVLILVELFCLLVQQLWLQECLKQLACSSSDLCTYTTTSIIVFLKSNQ
jgi:hypothetical protein